MFLRWQNCLNSHYHSAAMTTIHLLWRLQLLSNHCNYLSQHWNSNICKTTHCTTTQEKKFGWWEQETAFGIKLWTSVINVRTWEICKVSKGCATELSHSSPHVNTKFTKVYTAQQPVNFHPAQPEAAAVVCLFSNHFISQFLVGLKKIIKSIWCIFNFILINNSSFHIWSEACLQFKQICQVTAH